MKFEKTPIEGLFIIKPEVYEDQRGYFFESWNKEVFAQHGFNWDFVQDNQSFSAKNVLRGLHFQIPPYEQGKLTRVVNGSVLDVAVDLIKNSKTYGKHYKIVLNASEKKMFWIPPGFAHGFLALEDNSIFLYKCTKQYNKESERTILWNCRALNIDWGIKNPIVSPKDSKAPLFEEFESPFLL